MECKYNHEVQAEIDVVLKKIDVWKNLFSIKVEFYSDGWAIILKEDKVYARRIVIFKSVNNNLYSIKSFEVWFDDYKKEKFKEIFSAEVKSQEEVLKELKAVIYGKDLLNNLSEIYHNHF